MIQSKERSVLLQKCKELAYQPSILDCLEREIRRQGFAGSADIPKLVYLVLLTGILDKPSSLVIKGPSGAGKSFSLAKGKQFIPESAYEQFEGMSEKALVYLKGLDLRYKHLIIGEASGMADGDGRTLIRQLLSEGRVEFPRFDGHFSVFEGECFSCRERGTRTQRNSGINLLRWRGLVAVLKVWLESLSRVLPLSMAGSNRPNVTKAFAMMA